MAESNHSATCYVCLISAWFTSSLFQFLHSALFPGRLHLLINSCPTLYLTSHCFKWTTGYQLIAQVLLMIGIKTFFSRNFDLCKYVHTSTPKFRFHSRLRRSLTRVLFLSCLQDSVREDSGACEKCPGQCVARCRTNSRNVRNVRLRH